MMPASPAPSIPSTHPVGSIVSLEISTPPTSSQILTQNQPRQSSLPGGSIPGTSNPSIPPLIYDREPRTSLTHPINVSWIFPEELLTLRTESAPQSDSVQTLTPPAEAKPAKEPLDWLDRLGVEKLPMGRAPSASGFVGGFRVAASYLEKTAQQQQKLKASDPTVAGSMESIETVDVKPITSIYTAAPLPVVPHGNFALSSCPGKKVRLDTGPVNGRAMINRDLFLDFGRLSALGIKLIICCLNNAEMSYLGAPWAKYSEAAQKYGMDIVRIPIIEGSCPESMESLESVLTEIENRIGNGVNVLCHCRGGIGRAGLVACCYLIRRGYVVSAERAIQFVRVRRSPKAIETQVQEDFIQQYFDWVVSRRANGENVGPTL